MKKLLVNQMRRILIIVLVLAAFAMLLPINAGYEGHVEIKGVVPEPQNITFGIYTGGSTEIPLGNFSILKNVIKGRGFNIKNITDLTELGELEGVDVLALLTIKNLTNDEINIIRNYSFYGGDLFIITPQEIDKGMEDLLSLFGLESLGYVKDNESYYENESNVILNKTWRNTSITNGIKSLLVVNATALNYTMENGLLEFLGINETMPLNNETNISILYLNNLVWGGNNTYVEYKKGQKIYGKNITICHIQEYWFGTKIVVVSSAYMFEDEYIIKKGFDNLKFLERLIYWLGDQINYMAIDIVDRNPSENTLDLDESPIVEISFDIKLTNITDNNFKSNLTVLAGFEYLGKYRGVKLPILTNETYDNAHNNATLRYKVQLNISEIINKSAVIYVRIVAAMPLYGYRWNKPIRLDVIKQRFEFQRYHPVLLTIGAIVGINLIVLIGLMPYALKRRMRAKKIEEKAKK